MKKSKFGKGYDIMKFGFSKIHDGMMLCCTKERAEYIVTAVNSYEADKKHIAELEGILENIMNYSRCELGMGPEYSQTIHEAERLLKEVQDDIK
jgi:hypothetical protein